MATPLVQDVESQGSLVFDISGFPALSTLDRCDRCGVQAFVASHLPSHHRLLFCGHHFSRHEPVLLSQGWAIQDERKKINVTPSISANAE